jgi:hypothetical protein
MLLLHTISDNYFLSPYRLVVENLPTTCHGITRDKNPVRASSTAACIEGAFWHFVFLIIVSYKTLR